MNTIKSECSSFLACVSKASESIYLILLTFYVLIYFIIHTAWIREYIPVVDIVQYSLLSIVMWGTGLYLFFIIATWKNLWKEVFPLILTGTCIISLIYFFTKIMSTNLYGAVMDIALCILACGKHFRKMVKCIICVSFSYLLFAFIAMRFEITADLGKPNTAFPGHSLGIDYPNTWGYLMFLGLICLWYLYLKNKPILTFVFFWPISAFMYQYIRCRTIAGLTIIYPVIGLIIYFIEKSADTNAEKSIEMMNTVRTAAVDTENVINSEGEEAAENHEADIKTEDNKKEGKAIKKGKLSPLSWLIIAIPFLSWAFMMINSMNVEWWHQFYHGSLRNLAWRFIQGGLYFRTYGFPLIGNPYRGNHFTYVNVNDEFIEVGILDSSFASYLIMRGLIWLIIVLLWLCLAYWKALKKRDYAIILMETVFLGFAMMERPGLEMWYNFVLLYPLAKVLSKPGTERVLEFYEIINNEKGAVSEEIMDGSDSTVSNIDQMNGNESGDNDVKGMNPAEATSTTGAANTAEVTNAVEVTITSEVASAAEVDNTAEKIDGTEVTDVVKEMNTSEMTDPGEKTNTTEKINTDDVTE